MVAEIKNNADLYNLMQGVVNDFNSIKFGPLLKRGFQMLEEEHGVMFAEHREPNGNPWAPIAAITKAKKKFAVHGREAILVDSGRLWRSLVLPESPEAIRTTVDGWPGNVLMGFGTNVPYSDFHMTGGTAVIDGNVVEVPARPHIGMRERTLDMFTEQTADYVLAELMQ